MRPRFTIIDGIIAMEGQGPGSGTPRDLGSLFAAHDSVALDVALADRTAHERRSVYTIAASERRGLVDLDDPFHLAGDPIEPDTDFKPARRDMQERVPPSLQRTARNLITARPRLVDPDACTRCGECATICGADAITLTPLPDLRRPRSACAATPAPRSAPRRRSTTSRRGLARLFGARG